MNAIKWILVLFAVYIIILAGIRANMNGGTWLGNIQKLFISPFADKRYGTPLTNHELANRNFVVDP